MNIENIYQIKWSIIVIVEFENFNVNYHKILSIEKINDNLQQLFI